MKNVKDTDPENQTSFGEMIIHEKPKLLAIYYSMHNCPPCREFTPLLSMIYEEVNEDQKVMEIIFF